MRHLKVQEACHKLTQTTMNFAEISYACGFSDQSHFSRIHPRHEGRPTEPISTHPLTQFIH